MNILIKIQAFFAIRSRINEARILYQKDGKRRFVVPFSDGKMEVLTKDEAIALKTQGVLARDLTAKTLYNACYYWTGTDNSNDKIKCEMPKIEQKRRRKFFYNWFIIHHSKR